MDDGVSSHHSLLLHDQLSTSMVGTMQKCNGKPPVSLFRDVSSLRPLFFISLMENYKQMGYILAALLRKKAFCPSGCFVYSLSLRQCKVLHAIIGKPEILRFMSMTHQFPQRLCSSNSCTLSLQRGPGHKNKHTKAHI